MAEELELVKISELPKTQQVSEADIMLVVQGGVTKQAPQSVIRDYIVSELGSAAKAQTSDFEPAGAVEVVENQLNQNASQQNERIERLEYSIYLIQKNGVFKAYRTKALMLTDVAIIPVNSVVSVVNDPANNAQTNDINGEYHYNGTDFFKLPNNILDQLNIKTAAAEANAKSYADLKKAEAIQNAAFDAQIKADEALASAKRHADNEIQNNRKLIKKLYSASVFSIAGNLSNTGANVTGNTRKRTDYLSVRKGDVIDYSLIVTNVDATTNPLILWFDANKANQTTLSVHTPAANNTEYPFRTGSVAVPNDGFVIIQTQGSPQPYTDYTQQYFTKFYDESLFLRKEELIPSDVLNKSQLNTPTNALGYDATGGAVFNKSISTADFGFIGGVYRPYAQGNLSENLAGLTILTSSNAIRTAMLPISKGAKIVGSILRYAGIYNVIFFNQSKEFSGFLDEKPASGASIGTIDLTAPDDGYIVIQQLSLVSAVTIMITGKSRLLGKDDRDSSNGYLSKEYVARNYVSAEFKDITELYKGLCDVGITRFKDDLTTIQSNEFNASKYVKCLPNVTFNPIRFYTGNLVKTALFIFYDKDFNVLSSYVGDPGGDSSNTLIRFGLVTSPANTAYMRTCYAHSFSGTWDGIALNASSTVLNLKMDSAGREYYRYLTEESYKFEITGDSLGQGIEGSLRSAITDTYVMRASAIGGENVQDTLYRRSLNHITMKTKGLSVPSDGSIVSCSGWFDFDESFTFNADGSYTVDAIDKSEVFSATLNSRSDYNFTYKGQSFRFNMNAKTLKQVAPLGASAVTFDEDVVLSNSVPKLGKFAIVMMGTNGGFTKTGVATNTESAMNNLIECFQRIYDQYEGRVLFCGYHGARVAVRAYYRREMKRRFGEKFIDLPTFIMGRGRHLLGIDAFNSAEISFMNTNQGVTSDGGNSFIPLFSGDNTHPRTVVYRAFTNEVLRRAYQLGYFEKLYQAPIIHPTELSISGNNSVAVGATATLTVAFTAGLIDSSLFTWSSSNPAVATVSAENWMNSWATPKNQTTLVTGVSAGTATITCKARYGGATATFNITVQ